MRGRLKQPGKQAIYRQRQWVAEPVFGQIKQVRGFRQFLLRGKQKVRGEWSFICAGHNVLKLFVAHNEGLVRQFAGDGWAQLAAL